MDLTEMTYEQAMARVEAIVKELEQTDALSITSYKQKAEEAQRLLRHCESLLFNLEAELKVDHSSEK